MLAWFASGLNPRTILVSVSPRPTCTVPPLGAPVRSESRDAVEPLGGTAEPASADGAERRNGGAVAGAVVGAATGAADAADSPGVYTGGSSSTVYSRIKRPRAQFT